MDILALDIGGTAIKSAIATERGETRDLRETPTDAKLGGGPAVMELAKNIARSYSGFARIGISTAGQVDTHEGTIVFMNENIPGYTGTNVRRIFEEEFGVPVQVENDVNSAAVGETHFGAGRGFRDLLCLTYGTGIGGAIVIGRRVYGGSRGLAGEFGHIITHPDGRHCGCGQHGCYEQYASTTALVREARKLDPRFINGRLIFNAWREGDPAVRMVVDDWIDEIVFGLVTLVHIFNPNALILGGGILAEPYIEAEINRRIFRKVMPNFDGFKIVRAELKNTAGLLGAAYTAYLHAIGET